MSYINNKWALIRRGELTVTPVNIEIHPDFLLSLSCGKFEVAFRQVGDERKGMPEEILEMFRYSDLGCDAHTNKSCKKGVGYIFEDEPRWHCGCCNAPFWLHSRAERYFTVHQTG